jgi:hypothetical protein
MKRLTAATRFRVAASRGWSRSGRVLTLIAIGLVLAITGPSVLAPAAYASGCAAPSGAYATEVLSDSPVAYFPLDESSGPTICDDSGNSDNGTYATSGVTYGMPGPLADAALTAVQGDGSSSSLLGTAPAITGLTGNPSFTLEGWFKENTPTNEMVVALSGGNNAGMAAWSSHTTCGTGSNNNGSALALDEHGTSNCWDTTADGVNLFDGHWHYLAVVYDTNAGTMTGYVDGTSLGPEAASFSNFDWSTPTILLGGWIDNSVNQPFIGDAAQIGVYDTALSAARINAHYAAASAGETRYTVSATGTPAGGGSVTAADTNPDSSCAGASCTADAGDTVRLTAAPASGYVFSEWAGNGDPCYGSTMTTCTISDVQANSSTPAAEFLLLRPPGVSAYTTTSVNNTSETITTTVTSYDLSTTYSLDYGMTTAYGRTAPGGTVSETTKTVSFTLTGLTPGTTYHYKVMASSAGGSSDGGDSTFTTTGTPGPTISNVTGALASLTSANISGEIKDLPYTGMKVTYHVEYATSGDYTQAIQASAADPYDENTRFETIGVGTSNQIGIDGVLATLTGLSPATTYDYRVVASSNLSTTISYSANGTITTPPTGPTVTTASPSSVSSAGATMQGSIDDKGIAGKYKFSWSATLPAAQSGCSSNAGAVTGSTTGNLVAANVPLYVEALFNQPLPAGSTVTYTLEFDTTIDGLATDVPGGSVTFTTGSFAPSGPGTAIVGSATTAQLVAEVPGFVEHNENATDPVGQVGTDPSGGIEFTGTDTNEYGLFQYSDPGAASAVTYTNATYISSGCGTLTTANLTSLKPDTEYSYSPDQTFGLGTCPAMTVELPPIPITNVDQFDSVDWCWVGTDQELGMLLTESSGFSDSGGTNYYYYQAEYPTFIGPYLGPSNLPYAPIVGSTGTFTTAATTAPTSPTVTGTGVSDGLGCLSDASCGGTQTLKYAASTSPGSATRAGLKKPASKQIVLGETKFSIRPHHHKTIRFKLSRAGIKYLAQHSKATNAELVIVEQAGHGPKVTITRLLPTKPMKPTRIKPKPTHHKGVRR